MLRHDFPTQTEWGLSYPSEKDKDSIFEQKTDIRWMSVFVVIYGSLHVRA